MAAVGAEQAHHHGVWVGVGCLAPVEIDLKIHHVAVVVAEVFLLAALHHGRRGKGDGSEENSGGCFHRRPPFFPNTYTSDISAFVGPNQCWRTVDCHTKQSSTGRYLWYVPPNHPRPMVKSMLRCLPTASEYPYDRPAPKLTPSLWRPLPPNSKS